MCVMIKVTCDFVLITAYVRLMAFNLNDILINHGKLIYQLCDD